MQSTLTEQSFPSGMASGVWEDSVGWMIEMTVSRSVTALCSNSLVSCCGQTFLTATPAWATGKTLRAVKDDRWIITIRRAHILRKGLTEFCLVLLKTPQKQVSTKVPKKPGSLSDFYHRTRKFALFF